LTTQWARSGVAKLRELSLWGDVQGWRGFVHHPVGSALSEAKDNYHSFKEVITMAYSKKSLTTTRTPQRHSFDKGDDTVGTGMVGAGLRR
jgi:hypothetical protein